MADNTDAVVEWVITPVKAGMGNDNPPIGFTGGENYPILKNIRMCCIKTALIQVD